MNTTIKYPLFFFAFLLLPAALALGQTDIKIIYLKDGTTIQGKVVAQDDSTLVLETQYGTLDIQRRNILRQELAKQLPAKPKASETQTIYLKDGTTVKGVILFEDGDTLKVKTSYGIMSIPQSNVRRLSGRPQQAVEPISEREARQPTKTETLPTTSTASPQGEASWEYPTGEGSTMIGGAASFSVTEIKGVDESLKLIALAPEVVRFFASGIGLGFDMSLIWTSQGKASATSIAFGPKALLAFGSKASTTYPYLGFGANYLSVSQSYEAYNYSTRRYETQTQTSTGSIIKFGFGIMTKIAEHLVIPVEFGVAITNVESSRSTVYGLSVGLAGFLY